MVGVAKKTLSSSLPILPILAFFHVKFCYVSGQKVDVAGQKTLLCIETTALSS